MGNLSLACTYLKKAAMERVMLGQDVYHNVMRELGSVEIPEKGETLQLLQNLIHNKSKLMEAIPKENTNFNVQRGPKKFVGKNQERKVDMDNKENEWNFPAQKTGYEPQKSFKVMVNDQENQPPGIKTGGYNTFDKPKKTFWCNQENKENNSGFANLLKNRFR